MKKFFLNKEYSAFQVIGFNTAVVAGYERDIVIIICSLIIMISATILTFHYNWKRNKEYLEKNL